MEELAQLHVVLGTGPVGRSVIATLLATGRRVRAVNRSGRALLPPGAKQIRGDVSDATVAVEACRGASVVYQCLNPPYDRWAELFPPLQRSAIEAAGRANARLVTMENLYAYGRTGGASMTEETPLNPCSAKGEVRARMHEDLMKAHKVGTVRATVGRGADFFGPHAVLTAMGERVFYPALAGKKAQVLGDADQLHTYSYVPDIGRALVILGEREEALGRAWHLSVPESITTRSFVEKVYREAGTQSGIQAARRAMVWILGVVDRPVRELREMLYQFEEPFVMDTSRFNDTFGDASTPLDTAIAHTVAWFRGNPQAGGVGRAA